MSDLPHLEEKLLLAALGKMPRTTISMYPESSRGKLETKTGPGQLGQPGQGLVPLSPLQECCLSGPSTSLKAGFVLCGSPGHKLPHCTGLTTWNTIDDDDDYLGQVTTKAP